MDALSSVCTVLVTLLAVWSWFWTRRSRTDAPGPPTLPLLGNVLIFRKTPILVERMRALHRQYGDLVRLYLGPKLYILVTNPDDIQRVLSVTKRRDPTITRALNVALGEGLITNYGGKWKAHRKALQPAFRLEVVHTFITIFNDAAEFVCERLQKSAGSEINVHATLLAGSLKSIFESSLGEALEDHMPSTMTIDSFAELFDVGINYLQKRLFQPWMQLNCMMFLTTEGRTFLKHLKTFNGMAKHVLSSLATKPPSEECDQKMTLANVMLGRCGNLKFPEEEVYDEVRTFIVAGGDTTAATLASSLCLLGLYPEWQDRAAQELDEVYGSEGDYLRSSTVDDLSRLVVMESIIKEAMRLFPTIPMAIHICSEDIPLSGGQYVAPCGTSLMIAYSLLHRRPDVFPEPDKFDPSRFMPGGSASGRHPFSYLPFGWGARMCVGNRYAMVQMKTILSAVLRRFRFLPGTTREQLEDAILSISAHPLTGYRVVCEARQTPGSA